LGARLSRSLISVGKTLLATRGGPIVHFGPGENTDGLDIRRLTFQDVTFIGI